jgi:hypothetical protein
LGLIAVTHKNKTMEIFYSDSKFDQKLKQLATEGNCILSEEYKDKWQVTIIKLRDLKEDQVAFVPGTYAFSEYDHPKGYYSTPVRWDVRFKSLFPLEKIGQRPFLIDSEKLEVEVVLLVKSVDNGIGIIYSPLMVNNLN